MTLFIAWPWMATALFRSRWNEMSFGSLKFRSHLTAEGLGRRWALIYLAPIAAMLAGILFAIVGIAANEEASDAYFGIATVLVVFFALFYIGIPLATLHWYAKFYRNAADAMSLGELEFGFDATTWQWLKLFLGNIALAVVTLGFGLAYWGYRNWAFMVRHTHLYGEINVSELGQSTTRAPSEAEGFADAFDMGAI